MRAAAEWIVSEDDERVALPVLDALYTFLFMHSWFDGAETFELLGRTAGFDADDPGSASAVALAAAMYRVAIGARLGDDPAAEELAARCLPVLRARKLERELARCLCALGIMATYRDVYPEALAVLEEGVPIAGALGDGLTESGALMDLGFARLLLNDLDAAREAFEAAHALSERLGSPFLRAYATSKLGLLADAEERFGDAMRLHLEANELFAGIGDVGGVGYALSRASHGAYGTGDYEEALRLGRAGYEAFCEVNHRWGTIVALCRIGFATLALGDVDEARGPSARRSSERTPPGDRSSCSASGGRSAAPRHGRARAGGDGSHGVSARQLPPSYGFAARPVLMALVAELSGAAGGVGPLRQAPREAMVAERALRRGVNEASRSPRSAS